jgi:hypothetical protein
VTRLTLIIDISDRSDLCVLSRKQVAGDVVARRSASTDDSDPDLFARHETSEAIVPKSASMCMVDTVAG